METKEQNDLAATAIVGTVPMGTILAYSLSVDSIPAGWLLCDGSKIDPLKYPELIAALNKDQTPNLAGRTLIGTGTPSNAVQTDGTTPNFPSTVKWPVPNATGGEYANTLSIDQMPAHAHAITYSFWSSAQGGGSGDSTNLRNNTESKNTSSNGGTKPHNNMEPYYTVNYIIYTGK